MKFYPKQLSLYVVTSRQWLNGRSLVHCVTQAIKGGATMIQLREKNLSSTRYLALALQIKQICHTYHVPFIINDSLEVAIQSDADGIHVGQNDCNIDLIRQKWKNKNPIIGLSVQTFNQAKKAKKLGVSYIGVGAMYPTCTKSNAVLVSFTELEKILKLKIPTCAIGGIHMPQIPEILEYPVDGIALVSEIFNQANILQH